VTDTPLDEAMLLSQVAALPRPEACPSCQSTALRPIIYGLVRDGWPVAAADRGLVRLADCLMSLEGPEWECTSCRLQGGRLADHLPPKVLTRLQSHRSTRVDGRST
jgi:hypothetical protein